MPTSVIRPNLALGTRDKQRNPHCLGGLRPPGHCSPKGLKPLGARSTCDTRGVDPYQIEFALKQLLVEKLPCAEVQLTGSHVGHLKPFCLEMILGLAKVANYKCMATNYVRRDPFLRYGECSGIQICIFAPSRGALRRGGGFMHGG